MTVAEMRARVSAEEYLRWGIYFRRRAAEVELELKKAKG